MLLLTSQLGVVVRSASIVRWVLGASLLVSVLYFVVGAGLVRFAIGGALLPRTPAFSGPPPDSVERVTSEGGNELLIRRYGKARTGCVVFFPGQHGYASKYEVGIYTAAGLEVLLLAYPGQDGALGSASLDEVEGLASRAVRRANESCPSSKVVLLGVSFGALLAAYTSRTSEPAGLVLVSTAPSLSAAIRNRLKSRWYLAPLGVLPLSRVLRRDYTLVEALENSHADGTAIFQGTNDEQTPLSDLIDTSHHVEALRVVRVPGGSHSTTFTLAQDAQVVAIHRMLERHEFELSPREIDDF